MSPEEADQIINACPDQLLKAMYPIFSRLMAAEQGSPEHQKAVDDMRALRGEWVV